MNKAQLIDQVAEKAGMSRAAAARAFDAIFDTAGGAVSQAVHALGEVSIPGFGKFTKKTRAPRQGRNPRTGAVIDIPERSTISFTAGKNFREASPSGRRKAAGAPLGTAAGGTGGAAAPGKPRRGPANVPPPPAPPAATPPAGRGRAGGAAGGGNKGGAAGGGGAKGGRGR